MPLIREPVDVFSLYDMTPGPDACWPYIGSSWGGQPRDRRPYLQIKGRRQHTYRWIYELVNGCMLTADQLILHTCDCGGWPIGCGNPAHLKLGTNQDNMNDMTDRQRHGLPHAVVRAIRTLLEQGRTQEEIAALYGVGRTTISAIAVQRSHKRVE